MSSEQGRRPRLLFLSQTLPFPPHGGVQIRTYHTLRNLSREFDVTALCFYRWKPGRLEPDVNSALEALSEFGNIRAFPIEQEHSNRRRVLDHARSLAFQRVYTVSTYKSNDFATAIEAELNDGSIALVHLDSLDLSGYLPLVEHKPTVCVHHDAQSLLLTRRARHQGSLLMQKYFLHQAELMEREEAMICPTVDLNVTVSEADRDVLRGVAPTARFEVVPNGVDIEYFQPRTESESGIVFVGGLTWFPNMDALSYYRSKLLPRILRRIPDVPTAWVGRAAVAEIDEYSQPENGLQLTGYVDDVRPYIASAACYVVPIRIGGGTRIKILDAWAMGKAVVSTSIGCEGLDARHDENILIADSPDEFAERVTQVLTDEPLRRRLGWEARRTVEQRYSWDAIGDDMNQLYLDLIRSVQTPS